MMRCYTFLLPLAALGLLGCSPEKPAEPDTTALAHSSVAATPKLETAPVAPVAGGPTADATDPFAPLSKTPELDKKIADAEKSGDKTALANAYSKRGMFRMRDDDKAGQRVKYRGALADFRKALKTDPKNVEALAAKSEIESIYTGMGRPIPSEAEAEEVSRTGTYKPPTGK
ncbi:hypothetical protein [Armatimonas sp.]|uniref:hypothetical protein n=1 Tax=Armatimonas sp. TaxID=1872638 RepID=UPI003752AE82